MARKTGWTPDRRVKEREREFVEMAIGAAARSYSPYSGFPVGACVIWADPLNEGIVATVGCNVENAFYECGHAEQLAVMAGAALGYRRLLAVFVASLKADPQVSLSASMPCGFCRQWMSEFVPEGDDAEVVIVRADGSVRARFRLIAELLPRPFRLR